VLEIRWITFPFFALVLCSYLVARRHAAGAVVGRPRVFHLADVRTHHGRRCDGDQFLCAHWLE
jgi:hypothetical protein